MFPYTILASLIFCLSIYDCCREKFFKDRDLHLYLFITTVLFLILFVGFREVGFDYNSYRNIYNSCSRFWIDNSKVQMIEKSYALLNHIMPSYRSLLLFMAFITLTLQMSFIYKYSPAPFASIFFYIGVLLYGSVMGQYRQALALAIIVWAYALRDYKLRCLSLIILASLFHVSAVVALVIFFIPRHLCKGRLYLLLFLAAIIINLTAGTLITNAVQFLPAFVAAKFNTYASLQEGVIYGFNPAMVLRVTVFCIFYFNREYIASFRHGAFFYNIYFVSLLMYMALGFLPELSSRGSIYFYFVELVLSGMLIKIPQKGIYYFLFFAAISIYRQVSFLNEWNNNYIPYKNELFSLLVR